MYILQLSRSGGTRDSLIPEASNFIVRTFLGMAAAAAALLVDRLMYSCRRLTQRDHGSLYHYPSFSVLVSVCSCCPRWRKGLWLELFAKVTRPTRALCSGICAEVAAVSAVILRAVSSIFAVQFMPRSSC